MLGKVVLKHTDNLSQTLQHASLSAAEGQKIASMAVATFKSLHTDDDYDLFWKQAVQITEQLEVSEPQLPRKRRLPRQYDDGTPEEFPLTPKSTLQGCVF